MFIASGSGLTWWLALVPTGSLALAFVTAYAATYPQRKDHREREKANRAREARLDACADVVLGRDADPNKGQMYRIPGLAETVRSHDSKLESLDKKIGTTKDGRPLAQVLEESVAESRRVGMAQQDMAEIIEAQQETIRRNGGQVEAHERRLGRGDERINGLEAEVRRLQGTAGGGLGR